MRLTMKMSDVDKAARAIDLREKVKRELNEITLNPEFGVHQLAHLDAIAVSEIQAAATASYKRTIAKAEETLANLGIEVDQ